MRVEMNVGVLVEELGLAQKIVSRKETLPVIQYAMLEAADGKATLSATDLDITAQAVVPLVEGSGAGRMLLPVNRLAEIVRLMPAGDTLLMEVGKGHSIDLTGDGYQARMASLDPADFPTMPQPSGSGIKLSAEALSEMIGETSYAIGDKDDRYYLNGSQLRLEGGKMRMSSVDSHRLAMSEADCPEGAELEVLVPSKLVRELRGLLGGHEVVEVSEAGSHVFFRAGHRLVSSRKVDGKFAPIDRLVPKAHLIEVSIDRDRLALGTRRVSALAGERNGVLIGIEKGLVVLSMSKSDAGEATDRIVVDYTGEPAQIMLKNQYILDAMGAAPPGPVRLEINDEKKAAVFRPLGEAATASLSLVMPTQV